MKLKSIAGLCLAGLSLFGADHLTRYADGIKNDPTIARASKMNLKLPVMCREYHIWWTAPYGTGQRSAFWNHWKGRKLFGQYDPAKTIEQLEPGSDWRRWLNSVGYPLPGPYDSSQKSIIRWQLETARNAGIECLHVHLWPSLWGEGREFTPIEIFETVLDVAAELNYPVAVHDEIQFRRPRITKAQTMESSILRTALLMKRYRNHPGFYKIDGMPVYYFQNWSKWMKPEELGAYMEKVEQEAGPVYWMVEQSDDPAVFSLPRLKAVLSHNNAGVMRLKESKESWEQHKKSIVRAGKLAKKYGKKYGILVYTRFNNTHDRGNPKDPKIQSARDGNFFLDSVKAAMTAKPDFLVLTQWNDFEECAFIEPAWDFDGFNGDPYRWCRIVASMTGKKFTPAALPNREDLDPYIRHKLFGDRKKGDSGPMAERVRRIGGMLNIEWKKDADVKEVRLIQKRLPRWTPDTREYRGEAVRLANWSFCGESGELKPNRELRFYLPGLRSEAPRTVWCGMRIHLPEASRLTVLYRTPGENFRDDSVWKKSQAAYRNGFRYPQADGSEVYWFPLYRARFCGWEGDFTISLKGKESLFLQELVFWTPELKEQSGLENAAGMKQTSVAAGYDSLGNAGMPMLLPYGIAP